MNSLLEILQLYSWTENKINTHCTIISILAKSIKARLGYWSFNHFSRSVFQRSNELTFVTGESAELYSVYQMWRGHRTIIGAPEVLLYFRCVATFWDESESKATGIENRRQIRTLAFL